MINKFWDRKLTNLWQFSTL